MNENRKLNERMAGILNGLTEEQKKKARTCKSKKDLLDFLGAEGVELPDELLDSVAGGAGGGGGTIGSGGEVSCWVFDDTFRQTGQIRILIKQRSTGRKEVRKYG